MKKNIFRLYTLSQKYKKIAYGNTPLVDSLENNLWDKPSLEAYRFKWDSDDADKEVGNCPFLIGAIPVFKTEIFNQLEVVVPSDLIDTIFISVSGQNYSIIRARKIIKGLLNTKKSKIDFFSDGRIMNINKYVFNESNDLPLIFRLDEFPLFTFVDETLAVALSALNFESLIIEKCEIKKSWSFPFVK